MPGNRNHPFSNGCRYRHALCLDMDLEIQKIQYANEDYVLAKVVYLNRHWEQGNFVIHKENGVKLVKEHWHFWKRIGP